MIYRTVTQRRGFTIRARLGKKDSSCGQHYVKVHESPPAANAELI